MKTFTFPSAQISRLIQSLNEEKSLLNPLPLGGYFLGYNAPADLPKKKKPLLESLREYLP
jgi:hypothetical protein